MKRFALLSLCVVATAGLLGCAGRANPRVAEVEVDSGATRTLYTMSYNAAGELDEIEVEVNGDTSFTWKYTWDGGRIVQIETDNVGTDDVTRDLEWEGTRLVSKKEEGSNYEADTDYTYNDQGLIEKIEKHINYQGDSSSDEDWEFDYDDRGRIDEWTRTVRFEVFGIDSSTTESFDFRYDDDGRIEQADPGPGNDIEYDYNDDGTLDDVDDGGRITVEYDDQGRVDRIEDGSTDYDYTYDDGGDVSGIVFTPSGIPLGEMFDLAGRSHGTIPMETFSVLHQ